MMLERRAAAQRISQRQPHVVEHQIIEFFAVVPESDFNGAGLYLPLFRCDHRAECRIGILQLAEYQHPAIQGKAGPGRILLLRIAQIIGRGIAVGHREQRRQRVGRTRPQPHAEGRKGIGGTAARKIGRWHQRPAEHRIDEHQAFWRTMNS
jgi:hypothetical protein